MVGFVGFGMLMFIDGLCFCWFVAGPWKRLGAGVGCLYLTREKGFSVFFEKRWVVFCYKFCLDMDMVK